MKNTFLSEISSVVLLEEKIDYEKLRTIIDKTIVDQLKVFYRF